MKTIKYLSFIVVIALLASGCSNTKSIQTSATKNTSVISLKAPNESAAYGAEKELQQAIHKFKEGNRNRGIAELENLVNKYKSHNNELEIRIYTLLAIDALKVGDDIGFSFYRSQLSSYAKNKHRLPVQSQVILAMPGISENFPIKKDIVMWFEQYQ